jgi:hypothetical protein
MDWLIFVGVGLGTAALGQILITWWNGPFKVQRDTRRARKNGEK